MVPVAAQLSDEVVVAPETRLGPALTLVVLAAGTGSMTAEIAGARLLQPFFGSSSIVWANVIGLVLGALALGYWLGGRLADRRPSRPVLGSILVCAAALVAAIPFVEKPLLEWGADALDTYSAGEAVGSFVAALVLFAPPVVLLGMVPPFVIRLGVHDVRESGGIAGRVFALSTAGSLAGTFLPALVAIPLVGTQRTLLCAALVIAAATPLLLGRVAFVLVLAIAALLAVPPGLVRAGDIVFEGESRYQYVRVVEEEDGARKLFLNEGIAIHSLWRADTVLTGGEWDMFLVLPPLLERPVRHVAILGNAGGTTGRAYGVFFPGARIDGVELDPVVSDVGRRYLGLGDNPNLRIVTRDARPFLRRIDKRYDLILIDTYRQPYVPFYLATREFFELVRDRLAPGGMVALNAATVPDDTRLADEIAGTAATVFPQVLQWQALRLNQLIVGLETPKGADDLDRAAEQLPERIRVLGGLFASDANPAEPSKDPWTDDRAPVEWVTDRMILSYALRGGTASQELLPTAPR
jgi:spermidine synthase